MGLGDGQAGAFDPAALDALLDAQTAAGLDELIAANDARNAGLVNVDTLTALQSRFGASALPIALAGAGILALLLIPSSPPRSRRR